MLDKGKKGPDTEKRGRGRYICDGLGVGFVTDRLNKDLSLDSLRQIALAPSHEDVFDSYHTNILATAAFPERGSFPERCSPCALTHHGGCGKVRTDFEILQSTSCPNYLFCLKSSEQMR